MTSIVKVSCFPNEGTPEVIDGSPAAGDLVRITTPTGAVIYERYTPPSDPVAAPLSWDAYDFKMRFTAAERMAIRTAAKADAGVEDFLDMLDTAAATGTRIKADDELLNAGLLALENGGLINVGRAASILS